MNDGWGQKHPLPFIILIVALTKKAGGTGAAT